MSSVSRLQQISGSTLFQYLQTALDETYPSLISKKDKVWRDIVNAANLISLPAGTKLLDPETPCTQFMLLLEGCVRVFQQTPNDREVTLYRTHGGDLCVLSINGLMKDQKFGAFAESETAIKALALSREQFMHAMAVYEPFREFILTSLTDRFNDVLALIEETVFESLDTRLVCMLARLSKESGSDNLHITHQDLARELGSSREVISRLLKGLEKQGCIELGRGIIHIRI
jgi:CRP/FNR family transcriptional regulator